MCKKMKSEVLLSLFYKMKKLINWEANNLPKVTLLVNDDLGHLYLSHLAPDSMFWAAHALSFYSYALIIQMDAFVGLQHRLSSACITLSSDFHRFFLILQASALK